MEKRFECEDTGVVGGSKIFPVVILFGCETHNKEKFLCGTKINFCLS